MVVTQKFSTKTLVKKAQLGKYKKLSLLICRISKTRAFDWALDGGTTSHHWEKNLKNRRKWKTSEFQHMSQDELRETCEKEQSWLFADSRYSWFFNYALYGHNLTSSHREKKQG